MATKNNLQTESDIVISTKSPGKKNNLRPKLATLVVVLSTSTVGMALGYPSTAISNLNASKGPFKVNQFQFSWMASLFGLGGAFGAMFTGWAMDRFGRKTTLIFVTLPYAIGWVLMASAVNVEMMYAARLLSGFFSTFYTTVVSVYISEISPPKIRGHLASFQELSMSSGTLLMYILGDYLSWCWSAIFVVAVQTVLVILLLFVPETPRWLIMNNQREKAVKTLDWLRGEGMDSAEELKDIEDSVKDTTEMTPWSQYFKPPLLKLFLICQFMFILQESSGIGVVRQYTVTIFTDANTKLNPNLETIINGLVMFSGSIVFTLVVEKRERKTFLLMSFALMGLSLIGMGTFFQLKQHYPHFASKYLFWLPLLTMATTSFSYVLGMGPLPFIISNEMFPNRARGRASCMNVVTLYFCSFLVSKYFVNVSVTIGMGGAFFVCAGLCVVGFVVVFFTVPLTKGKKLEVIQVELTALEGCRL